MSPVTMIADVSQISLYQEAKRRIEIHLQQLFPEASDELTKATRYAVLAGGKRLRSYLVYATAEALAVSWATVDPIAIAIELIHTYSLVHDDLPAMDNDDLRRGQPSCHIAFSDAMAILVGDALQSKAFELITTTPTTAEKQVAMVQLLAKAIGGQGMAQGQALEFDSHYAVTTLAQLARLHHLKTGLLFRVCVELVNIVSDLPANAGQALIHFAENLGLAFQIKDDILDMTTTTGSLGKPAHSDAQANKVTYVTLLGLAKASALLDQTITTAVTHLENSAFATTQLREIAHMVRERHS